MVPATKQPTTALLMVMILWIGTTAASGPDGAAALHGRVIEADSLAALPGANVLLVPRSGATAPASGTTDRTGTYSVTGLAAGTYDLAVRVGDQVYPASQPLRVESGSRGRFDVLLLPAGAGETPQSPRSVLGRPSYATLIVVGSAVVAGLILDAVLDEDPVVSPVQP